MIREHVLEMEQILHRFSESNLPEQQQIDLHKIKEFLMPIIETEKERMEKEALGLKYSWLKFHPLKKLQDAVNTLSSVTNLFIEAKEAEEVYERETQDLLHQIELTETDSEENDEIVENLRHLRKQRRNAKDFLDLAAPLKNYSLHNRQVIRDLGQVHAEMIQISKNLDNRSYKVREKTSLQEAFDKARMDTMAKTAAAREL